MTDEKRALKVFLCHAHSDKDAVKALYARLKREGVDVWLDKEKLLPGADWELEIRKAVREADVVVVCLSKQFNQAGFRQKEVRIALDAAMEKPDGEIFIIPARLEECDTLESLSKWHWVDLFESDGFQKLIRALRIRAEKIGATLRQRKGGGATVSHPKIDGKQEAAEKIAAEKEERNKKTRKPNIFIVASLIGLVGITVALISSPLFEGLFFRASEPMATTSFTPTRTEIPAKASIPTLTPTHFSVVLAPCNLSTDNLGGDYLVSEHLLLEDIYKKQYANNPDADDLYAIAYYNNRKILEGYSKYHAIDPVTMDAGKGWKIFIPPQKWIDDYKEFPATIPQPVQIEMPSKLYISGSSILSHLSVQISQCSAETTKVELVQINLGNTILGLRDLCQGKVDLFGANKEVDATMMAVHLCGDIELEKFEVARYAMVVVINRSNPYADDMQSNPLTNEELTKLLTAARSWKDVRGYWDNNESIAKYYPTLESGEFEIVRNGIFPALIFDGDEGDVPGLSVNNDKQSLIDKVAEDANAVGIVDYASYQNYQYRDQLIAIPVNGVYVSSAIANNDTRYPLMVTLYLYAGKNAYETDETLRSFINYYLAHELDFLDDLGYLYPSKKGYAGNRDTVP